MYCGSIPNPCSDGSSSKTYWDFSQKKFPTTKKIPCRRWPVFCKLLPGDKRMLLLRKEVSVSTSHVLEKLCAAHRNLLRNQNSLPGETIWSNISSIFRFYQNLKSWANFNKKTLFRVCGLMTKTLTPLELSLYEGYGALLSLVL